MLSDSEEEFHNYFDQWEYNLRCLLNILEYLEYSKATIEREIIWVEPKFLVHGLQIISAIRIRSCIHFNGTIWYNNHVLSSLCAEDIKMHKIQLLSALLLSHSPVMDINNKIFTLKAYRTWSISSSYKSLLNAIPLLVFMSLAFYNLQ